jgi:hypothetical protein
MLEIPMRVPTTHPTVLPHIPPRVYFDAWSPQ